MSRKSIWQFSLSVCYVGLLLVFAYTSVFYEVLVIGEKGFLSVYNGAQSSVSNFLVNCGLLLLLLVDYAYDKKVVPRWTLTFSVLAFVLLVGVHYLALKVDTITNYNAPFSWPWFGVLIFVVFIAYLVIVKLFSLPSTNNKVIVEEIYKS